MIRRRLLLTAEKGLRTAAWLRGKGRYAPPQTYFGPGGVEEAEALCEAANEDFAAFLRPPETLRVTGLSLGVRVPGPGGTTRQLVSFDSPCPSGRTANDRVTLRIVRPRDGGTRGVIFHHPVRQDRWTAWDWFLGDTLRSVPVAMMVAPHHFQRAEGARFAGEWTCNANPWRLFEAIRQWTWDEAASRRVLVEHCGFEPGALVGFSLGAFQSLLSGALGFHELPIVSIACTNRYAHGVFHGVLSGGMRRGMLEVGIDEPRLARMARSIELERWVPALRSRPTILIEGEHDRVDPPPSLSRLREALAPASSIRLPAGHATMLLHRRRVAGATLGFLREVGVHGDGASGSGSS